MLKWMACVAFLCLMLVGCDKLPTLSTPESPQFLISDGAHNSGNEHFFFLPPMTDEATQNGLFDRTLAPEVVVCVWIENSCTSTIAAFTTETGSGSETIRLDVEEEHYIINWHTDEVAEDFVLSEDETYRIRVLADGQELGFADVVVVSNGAALRTVLTDEVVALVDGRTLPVKFRIE